MASIHNLAIREPFERLSNEEKRYAHHLSRAAWQGARIILKQTSREAPGIFDFILALGRKYSNQWQDLARQARLSRGDLDAVIDYAGTFLSNIGNYYGSGDKKFVPDTTPDAIARLATAAGLTSMLEPILEPMFSVPPYSLGMPGKDTQSAYYLGRDWARTDIDSMNKFMEDKCVLPENTRLLREQYEMETTYYIQQASIRTSMSEIGHLQHGSRVMLHQGDHAKELDLICFSLREALKYTAGNRDRTEALAKYVESFTSGDLQAYKDSQRAWVKDKGPSVENIFGFVEPYRDPSGVRSEFEGIVAISNPEETKALTRFVGESSTFIRRLPWAIGHRENEGKGPFEKSLFEPPDFTSIHALTYCSSYLFEGINLPNYNDIRQESGFKNVIIANRMAVEGDNSVPCPYLDSQEALTFAEARFATCYLRVALHELLGHGTSKLLAEVSSGNYNFDPDSPPTNPVSGLPIMSWYRPGQTWTSQFGDIATAVDECRAELVAAYLMDDKDLLALFGYTDHSPVTADAVLYNSSQQLGVDGLRSLSNYHSESKTWGRAHSRGHFSTLKWLLRDSNGFLTVDCDSTSRKLSVHVDRSKIISHGKPSIGRMLLRLHIYRCTADVAACRSFFEDLSAVDGQYLEWRDIVIRSSEPKLKYVQANTFIDPSGNVGLREYEPTNIGIIQSWLDRME